MKFDLQLLLLFVGVGLFTKKLSWKGWLAVGVLVFVWMMWNWKHYSA